MLNCGDLVKFFNSEAGFKVGDHVRHSPHKQLMLEFKAAREVGFGSKCEELRVSKISPLHPTKPTSMKGVVTSLWVNRRHRSPVASPCPAQFPRANAVCTLDEICRITG